MSLKPSGPADWCCTAVGIAVAILLIWVYLVPDAGAAKKSPRIYTSKATCYQLQGRTASGTLVNRRTAAHNFLRPGTKIRLVGKQTGPGGIRRYIIRDTGPALRDGHFDLWAPANCMQFGVKTIKWKIGWGAP